MQPSIEVRRVDLWTLFRVSFFLYAAMGLIAGVFYAMVLLVAGGIGRSYLLEEDLGFGVLGGALSLIVVPIFAFFYAAMGSAVVTVVGALFNLVCRLGGGIRFEASVLGLGAPPMGARPPVPTPMPPTPPAAPPPASPPPGAAPPTSPPPGGEVT